MKSKKSRNSSSGGGTTSSLSTGPTSLTFTSGPNTFNVSVKNFVGDAIIAASAKSVLALASSISRAVSSAPMMTPSGITGVAWMITRTSAAATQLASSRHSCPPTVASPNASACSSTRTPTLCECAVSDRFCLTVCPYASRSSRRPVAFAAIGGDCGTGGGAGSVGGDAGGGDGGGGGIGGEGIGGMCEPSSSLPSYVAHPRSYIPAPGTVRFASMTSRAVTLKPFAASVLTTWTNASCSVPSTPSADAIPPLAAAGDDPVNHAPNVTET